MSDITVPQNELISFLVGGQEFCVDIMAVREIRGWAASTPLPHAPSYVLGVINLRGAVLAVVDLAARLGLPSSDPGSSHVVIVVCIGPNMVGLLVDAVCDIFTVTPDMLQRPPRLDDSVGLVEMITGIMTIDGRMCTLIDLDRVLPAPALAA